MQSLPGCLGVGKDSLSWSGLKVDPVLCSGLKVAPWLGLEVVEVWLELEVGLEVGAWLERVEVWLGLKDVEDDKVVVVIVVVVVVVVVVVAISLVVPPIVPSLVLLLEGDGSVVAKKNIEFYAVLKMTHLFGIEILLVAK